MTETNQATGDEDGVEDDLAAASPDLDALARQYMDLWEERLAAMGQDPAVVDTMARAIELMNTGAAAFASMAAQGIHGHGMPSADGRHPEPATGDQVEQADATRPAAPGRRDRSDAAPDGHAHRPADLDVDDLRQRIAGLEDRIARLESALAPGGKESG